MSTIVEGGQLTLNLTELNDVKSSFQSNYSVPGHPSALQNELEFSWKTFKEWALNGVTPDLTILGMIHRYDQNSENWYLTAGRYAFNGYTAPGSYPITGPSGLFNLNADGTISGYSGGLEDTGMNYYDPEYFNNVQYQSNPLDLQTNVRSVHFAWEELKQLHCDNKSAIQNPNDDLFTIRFCSISPDYSSYPGQALVGFPHMIAAYMAYDGTPLLNDDPVVQNAVFINKAADFVSACPPTCNTYSWPAGLTPKNC